MPFSIHNMAWSGEHRAFVVEEFIANGGSLIATLRAFSICFAVSRQDPVLDKKKQFTTGCQTSDKQVLL